MKLKEGFITHTIDNEQIMVSVNGDFSGMVRSNSTAAAIIGFLSEETDRDGIVEKMKEIYEAPEGSIERDVDRVLESLRSIGAINE